MVMRHFEMGSHYSIFTLQSQFGIVDLLWMNQHKHIVRGGGGDEQKDRNYVGRRARCPKTLLTRIVTVSELANSDTRKLVHRGTRFV